VTAPPAAAIQVRRLTYADLPQVVAIERRAFTSPWSLAMFVLELSKPSGICLAAQVMPKATDGEALAETGSAASSALHDLLALRHRLAHHERGGRPEPAPPRIATALLSACSSAWPWTRS